MVNGGGAPRARWLWWRWSWRDLRHHAVAVAAIAAVMSIGIGVYAGLGSTATWRRDSNDASFATLAMHDLRVTLSPGTFAPAGTLAAAAASIADAPAVVAVAERLVVDSQVDTAAGTGPDSVLVRARLVGMALDAGPTVDDVWVRDGDLPADGAATSGTDRAAAILEAKFADDNDLPSRGSVTVAGGREVAYTGLGVSPEDFFYGGPEGTVLSQGDFAILYLPLRTAQDLAGEPGQVNDLVLTLTDGADRDAIEAQLAATMSGLGLGATTSTRDDAVAVRVLYEDIDNDQRVWNMLSALVLTSAALAAFNLVSRIVEAQRREIGIGMALGVSPRLLAIRPMLVGVQVAVAGSLAGLGVGVWVGGAMVDLLESFVPLPIYVTDFQWGVYARAAALGLVIPVAAGAFPVWRALRVEPIMAIRTGHLTAKASRLSDWTSRLRLPGSSLTQMAFRNVLRTPRRTILTAVGVGAAITALVAVLGMLDSFNRTIDLGSAELSRGRPGRVIIQLDTFYGRDDETVAAIESDPSIDRADAGLRLPATALPAGAGDDEFEVVVELVDLDAASWAPTIDPGARDGGREGIILARKAAADLGVTVGDTVVLRHPVRSPDGSFALVESGFTVTGTHPNPLRAFAFADMGLATEFGLDGTVNVLNAYPTDGVDDDALQRAVFDLPGVTSSQAVAGISEGFDRALEQFLGFMAIAGGAVLILALLIAFNTSRITMEERRREHATMQAFGLPVRSVMGGVVKESVLIGLLATLIGVVAGLAFLGWMLRSIAETTLPDLGIDTYLAPASLGVAAAVGIVAVAVAPLLLWRRLRRMNIPDTLRVME